MHASGLALDDTLRSFYAVRRWNPAFVLKSDEGARANDLVTVLKAATLEGLDPVDYGAFELERRLSAAVRTGMTWTDLARLEIDLARATLLYCADLSLGRLDPRSLPLIWEFPRRQVSISDPLRAIAAGASPAEALDTMAPPHTRYRALREYRRLYNELAPNAWPFVPAGQTLRLGDRAPRVRLAALEARLAAEGWLSPSTSSWLLANRADNGDGSEEGVFDERFEAAIRAFQVRYGLDPDGVIGPRTIAALNVPPGRRLREIELNMEFWRRLPAMLPANRVEVNVPAYELTVFEADSVLRRMRVIVGKEGWETPAFSARMRYIVVNPYWFVPRSIAVDEILPKVQEDPDYLDQNGYRVFERWRDASVDAEPDDQAIDPGWIDWSLVTPESFSWVVRQNPGPRNPLGNLKFMFPNAHSIYLHGTPSRGLFARHRRAFSHGCIRIEDPVWFAAHLLQSKEDWSEARIRRDIDGGATRQIDLPAQVPVYILHFSVFPDSAGRVVFCEDLYGVRLQTEQALARLTRVAAQ